MDVRKSRRAESGKGRRKPERASTSARPASALPRAVSGLVRERLPPVVIRVAGAPESKTRSSIGRGALRVEIRLA